GACPARLVLQPGLPPALPGAGRLRRAGRPVRQIAREDARARARAVRLLTVRTPEGTRDARLEGDELVLLDHADVGALLASDPSWRTAAERADGPRVALSGADLAPVVPRPSKIV